MRDQTSFGKLVRWARKAASKGRIDFQYRLVQDRLEIAVSHASGEWSVWEADVVHSQHGLEDK